MAWLNLYILTFNCARNTIDPDLFASHIFDGLPQSNPNSPDFPEILVLSLQEVAPIAYSFLGGSFLESYFNAFRRAVDMATATGETRYRNTLTGNVGMTAIMVFVRDDVAGRVSWTGMAEVGVGIQECGNKGAVGARIGYQINAGSDSDGGEETVELTFVAAHLAPSENAVERRNEDWKDISQRLVFTKRDAVEGTRPHPARDEEQDEEGMPLLSGSTTGNKASSMYSPNSYLFVAGDFNYRTSSEGPGPDDYKTFPQPGYDTDHPNHYKYLLAKDQLTRELQANRTLHGLSEMPIHFPPSYKYTIEARQASSYNPILDHFSWASHRWPSWCDRILYLENPSKRGDGDDDEDDADNNGRRVKAHKYDILPLFPSSDHRPVALSVSVPLRKTTETAGQETTALSPFKIDPTWESRRAAARRKEIITGAAAYLGLTWEGNGLMLAICLGTAAGYFTMQGLVAG